MSKHPVFLAVLASLLVGGCAESPQKARSKRMTPEESGYMGELGTLLVQVSGTQTGKMPMMVIDEESDKTSYILMSGTNDWAGLRASLKDTMPPDSLRSLHISLLAYLQARTDNNESAAKEAAATTMSHLKTFNDAVMARQPQTNNTTTTKFVYTPPLIPVGTLTVDDTGRCRIESGDSVNTPVGSFGMAKSNPKGVTRLVIRADGKQRIFRVDRPFQVFVPTDYGVDISGDGDRKMIIEVKKK